MAAIAGRELPSAGGGDPLARHERASRDFVRLVRAIRDRSAWDDAFVDPGADLQRSAACRT